MLSTRLSSKLSNLLVVLMMFSSFASTQAASSSELRPEAIFIVPSLPIIFNVVSQLLYCTDISCLYMIPRHLKHKHFNIPYLELFSLGGISLIMIHIAICIAVGVTTYQGERSAGSDDKEAMITVSGILAVMNFWIAILPTSKTSLLSWLTNVPFERAVKYHRLVVLVAMIVTIVHLSFNYEINESIIYSPNATDIDIRPLYGFLAFLTASVMVITASDPIRLYAYEFFFMFHHLYIVVVVFIILHSLESLPGFLPGIILHGIDQSYKLFCRLTAANAVKASAKDEIVSITVPVNPYIYKYSYQLGGYCFIHVPDVSLWEWHPFTIAHYDAAASTVSFHIKALHNPSCFTRKLYDHIQSSSKPLKVAVFGPYGSLSLDLKRYDRVYLFAGGIGITPMMSIIEAMAQRRLNRVKNIHLIWSIRDTKILDSINLKELCHGSSDLELDQLSPLQSPDDDFKTSPSSSRRMLEVVIHLTSSDQVSKLDHAAVRAKLPGSPSRVDDTTRAEVDLPCSCSLETARPNYHDITEAISATHINANKEGVAVIICGPQSMNQAAVKAAIAANIDFHLETFNY
jgi:predicted ferric reductase